MQANENYRIATINNVTPRSVYPTLPGLTVGTQASQSGDATIDGAAGIVATFLGPSGTGWQSTAGYRGLPTGGQNVQLNAAQQAAGGSGAAAGKRNAQGAPSTDSLPGGPSSSAGGFVANPVTWVVVLGVLIAGTILLAHKVGKAEEFANIRGSAYNIFYVGLIAIVAILVLKTIFARFQIPGLSDAILAV